MGAWIYPKRLNARVQRSKGAGKKEKRGMFSELGECTEKSEKG
jgi:hypothetical protein